MFRTLTHLEHKTCRVCKMIRHIRSPGIVRTLFKYFQGYLGIFTEIDAFINTHRNAAKEGVSGWGSTFFWKAKTMHGFGEKRSHCVHYWLKFSIQNVVLRVSKRKTLKCFPAGPFFLVFLTKYLWKCLSSTKLPLPENFWLSASTQSLLFLQNTPF